MRTRWQQLSEGTRANIAALVSFLIGLLLVAGCAHTGSTIPKPQQGGSAVVPVLMGTTPKPVELHQGENAQTPSTVTETATTTIALPAGSKIATIVSNVPVTITLPTNTVQVQHYERVTTIGYAQKDVARETAAQSQEREQEQQNIISSTKMITWFGLGLFLASIVIVCLQAYPPVAALVSVSSAYWLAGGGIFLMIEAAAINVFSTMLLDHAVAVLITMAVSAFLAVAIPGFWWLAHRHATHAAKAKQNTTKPNGS